MLMLNQVKNNFISIREKKSTQKIQPKNMHHVEYIILNHSRYLNFLQKIIKKTKREAYVSLIFNLMKKSNLKLNIFELKNLFAWELL